MREMMIEGVLAVQAGENPRIVRERLETYMPPKLRGAAEAAGGRRRRRRGSARPHRHSDGQARRQHEGEDNAERWLLTYADMITLLLVFFIVLYSMANIDKKKFATVASRCRGPSATARWSRSPAWSAVPAAVSPAPLFSPTCRSNSRTSSAWGLDGRVRRPGRPGRRHRREHDL